MRIPILLGASVISMVIGGCQLLSGVTKLEVTTGGATGGAGNTNCGDGHLDPGEICDDGAANGEPGKCLADCSAVSKPVKVSGVATPLVDPVHNRISGAVISVLELDEQGTVTTGSDGAFSFDGIYQGAEVTLVMQHSDYPLTQTGTHVVPVEGIADLNFQSPSNPAYTALLASLLITPDPTKCQLSMTVTRKGGSILENGPQGEAGVTVTIEPAVPDGSGPIYFNSSNLPNKSLTETSDDGGVLFTNVPPGEYVLSGHKVGVELGDVKLKCRAGVAVIASAPRGMNVL